MDISSSEFDIDAELLQFKHEPSPAIDPDVESHTSQGIRISNNSRFTSDDNLGAAGVVLETKTARKDKRIRLSHKSISSSSLKESVKTDNSNSRLFRKRKFAVQQPTIETYFENKPQR